MTRVARLRAGLALGAVALAPQPAAAHLVGVEFGAFYAGALHILMAVDQGALLGAFALLIGLQSRKDGRWALLTVPAALFAGAAATAVLGTTWPGDAAAGVATIAAFAVLGALAAARACLGAGAVALAGTLVGLVAGVANGVAARGGAVDPWLYAAGVAGAGAVALTLGSALAVAGAARVPVLGIGYRVVGSWLAAVGVIALGLAVAQAGG